MKIEQLYTFIAVAEEKSFRKGAARIFKSQSTVSASIKALEKEFKFLLFNRDNYKVRLTTKGRAFYGYAKKTINNIEELRLRGSQLSQGIESEYSIVISASCDIKPILGKISTIVNDFPYTKTRIVTEYLTGVVERLNDGDVDLAFGANIGLDVTHEKVLLYKVPFVTVASLNYIKSDEGNTISQEEIINYSQIVVSDSARHTEKESFCIIPDCEYWHVNDYTLKKELTISGLGWGRMPEHLISDELKSGELIALNIEGVPTYDTKEMYIFRKRNKRVGQFADKIWDLFVDGQEVCLKP